MRTCASLFRNTSVTVTHLSLTIRSHSFIAQKASYWYVREALIQQVTIRLISFRNYYPFSCYKQSCSYLRSKRLTSYIWTGSSNHELTVAFEVPSENVLIKCGCSKMIQVVFFYFHVLQLYSKSLYFLPLQNLQFESSTPSRPQTVNLVVFVHKATWGLRMTQPAYQDPKYLELSNYPSQSAIEHTITEVLIIQVRRYHFFVNTLYMCPFLPQRYW